MTTVSANNTIDLCSTPQYIPTPFPGVPEHLRCRYTSKPCGNLRTTKRGGGLHRFCDFHRARANENQWRVDHRRRLRKLETGSPKAPPRDRSPRNQMCSPTNALPVLMPNDCSVGFADKSDLLLSTEDLLVLHMLLFNDGNEDQDLKICDL